MDIQPYSYQTDTLVPPFPDDRAVVFYDGVCVLCSGFARFVIRHDVERKIMLCQAQSPLGQAIYRHYGLSATEFETYLLLWQGRLFVKSAAFFEIMGIIGGVWSLVRILRIFPVFIRERTYDFIARNRYRWFGKRDLCEAPSLEERGRFLS